jgi:SAM-dependent methyltransferase
MELHDRPCPICRTAGAAHTMFPAKVDIAGLDAYAFASRKTPEYMHYRLLRCDTCDALFASPAPSPETLAHEYDRAAYDSDVEANFAAETYARYLTKHILPVLAHRRGALDIGTGNGAFLGRLLELGFSEVGGVEPSAAPIAVASASVRPLIRHGMFRAADFEPSSLSLVSCFQTIEHVSDPLALAKEAFELLRPGGALFLVSHNYRSLHTRVLGERSPIFDVEHLQLFSVGSLRQLLTKAGFVDVDIAPLANRYPLHYWLRLLPLPARPRRAFNDVLVRLRLSGVPISLRAGNLATFGTKPHT